MTKRNAVVRVVVIGLGIAVTVPSLLTFRLDDWPIYTTYLLLAPILFLPHVGVLPNLAMPIPGLAATFGFLYIGGLPIIALRNVAELLTWALYESLPETSRTRIPGLEPDAGQRNIVWRSITERNAALAADWALLTLGLATRWLIAWMLVPVGRPAAHPAAIAVAELGGYAIMGALNVFPIYSYRAVLHAGEQRKNRTALNDLGLITSMALTPFVFLITYGFMQHGIAGAATWSVAALGLHFMLRRLNERRLALEEQNRRLEALNRELEHRERLSAIGKMSSIVSHQILQELGVIGIYADLIRHSDGDADAPARIAEARANAIAIEGALADVNRVLTDLLVFSKDLRLNAYEHPLVRVVEEALEGCRAEAAEHGVRLRFDAGPEVTIMLDKLKIKQALANVIRNAIEASPRNGEVVVCPRVRDGAAEIVVADSGPGIADANREKVFTPFFTTKERGTGLGLAIAREFTEAHGGRLRVERGASGRGTNFVLELPIRREP